MIEKVVKYEKQVFGEENQINCRDEFFVNVCTCVCIINVMVSR